MEKDEWKISTTGIVLEELSDDEGPLGLAYFKGSDLFGITAQFGRPSCIFPRCHSMLRIEFGKKNLQLDAYAVLLVPPKIEYKISGVTPISHFSVFIPKETILARTSEIFSIEADEWSKIFAEPLIFRRPNWLNEVMHRYVYERVVAGNKDNYATSFLEPELMKEIYYSSKEKNIALKNRFNLDDQNLDKKSPLVRKAMIYIEAHLFNNFGMEDLAAELSASESTILRAFTKDLRRSPFSYIKERRLDEANALLKTCKFSVSEVAALVGYENVSAFISAFKGRFGHTPSSVERKKRA